MLDNKSSQKMKISWLVILILLHRTKCIFFSADFNQDLTDTKILISESKFFTSIKWHFMDIVTINLTHKIDSSEVDRAILRKMLYVMDITLICETCKAVKICKTQ